MATGMIGKKSIIGPIADQQEITGKVNNAIQMAFYKGLETDTAKVIIDNASIERTIKTDVKRTPNSLTITDKTDSLEPANWVVSHFNGSEELAIQLKHYTIKHLPSSNKEFALFKNGVQEGEIISIPDGETIDEVILVLDSGVPYLEFTFKNSTREPLFCSLEGLGIAAIIDYTNELPEITTENKDNLARLDGDEVYAAKYLVQPGQDVKILFDFANNGRQITSAELAEQAYISDISCDVQGYTARLILPDEVYCAIRSGSNNNPGTLSFNVDRLPEEGNLYAVFANYFGFNTSTQAVTGATNTSITVTYPDGSTVDFDLPFVSATVKPDDHLIDLFQLGTYSVAIRSGVTVNRYYFRGIAYSQAASEVKEWKQLARTEYVDEQIETVENEITTLATEVAQNSLDIETSQAETTNLNVRVTTIETEIGTVQVFDADELPEATVDYLDKIYRVDGKLYQVISLGDGFQKEYSFSGVTGTSEIANKDSWDGFAQQVTNNLNIDFDLSGYVEQAWKPATSFRNDGTEYRNSSASLSEAFTMLDSSDPAITITSYVGDSVLEIPAMCKVVDFNSEMANSIYVEGDFGGCPISGDNRQIYFTCQMPSMLDNNLLGYFEELSDIEHYEISKIYRNTGEIKFGSSSAVGHFEIIKTGNIELPISKISVRVKSWSDVKSGCLYTAICDENGAQLSNESFEIPASADWTDIEIYADNLEHDAKRIWLGSVDYPAADDRRLHMLAITVTYGVFSYEWKEISGGANVEIVEELPEEGEENTIYLIKDQAGGGSGSSEDESAESAGTVTSVSISMNGEVKGTVTTSGTIDLGTVVTDDSGKENITNKVTAISATSTDTEYPSAKAVYDLIMATINGRQ